MSTFMIPKQHYSDTGLTNQTEIDSKDLLKTQKRKERKREKTFLEEGRRRSSVRTLKSD